PTAPPRRSLSRDSAGRSWQLQGRRAGRTTGEAVSRRRLTARTPSAAVVAGQRLEVLPQLEVVPVARLEVFVEHLRRHPADQEEVVEVKGRLALRLGVRA